MVHGGTEGFFGTNFFNMPYKKAVDDLGTRMKTLINLASYKESLVQALTMKLY